MVDDVLKNAGTFPIGDDIAYFPSSQIDSLLSPIVHVSLKPVINKSMPLRVYSYQTPQNIDRYKGLLIDYNTEKELLSKRFGYPIVDIYSLYEKIIKGTYITDDGIRADPSWSNGNFFSSEGIYPSAFGQAIIANEVIKILNNHYKTEIPLIRTADYLNVK